MIRLNWKPATTPTDLQTALRTLAQEYPIVENKTAPVTMEFKSISSPKRTFHISRTGKTAVIEYSDPTAALRAVGSLLSGIDIPSEETSFTTFGIMLDCSRNAVMTIDHFKGWLRKLALLGYNIAMLYTEDTYQIPGEPYFGYHRGAYTPEELCDIDQYAARLGMEMIPCIQTLGHLEQILKWTAYDSVRDTSSVLLVDEEKTYELIEKMIKHSAEVFKSRRIHIGMDETHDLGRGRFMDLYGYKRGFDIFNEHLARVIEICKKYDLKPMIWSDMYFRMGSQTLDYYDKTCVIPDDVKAKIPKDVQMVYWDYYHDNEEFYLDWIKRHRELGSEPLMGSGVWTWAVLWYGREITEKTAGPCIRAALKEGLKEILFTLWGDDGAYCEFDSAMAGLTWVAELAWTAQTPPEILARRFAALCHGDYSENMIAAELQMPDGIWGRELLWDDPILGIYWHNSKITPVFSWQTIRDRLAVTAEKLQTVKTKTTTGGDFKYARALIRFLVKKIDLRLNLDIAYAALDKAALKNSLAEIAQAVDLLKKLDAAFRTQWLRRNKPFGLEVIQIRFAGQKRRYEELAQRIKDLLEGKIGRIEEFENLPTVPLKGINGIYRGVASGSSIQ
jgi:hexosaminidase